MSFLTAATTVLSVEEVRSAIQEAYALAPEYEVTPVSMGRNLIYQLGVPGQTLIARFRPLRADAPSACVEADAMDFLARQGVPVSIPQRCRDQALRAAIKSRPGAFELAVYTSAVGRQLRSDAREFHALGAGLAAIHRSLDDYAPFHPVPSLGRAHLLERPLELIMPRVSTAPLRGSLERAVERLRPVLDGLSTQGPGYGICHGDAHHGNAHVDDSGAITFFDFEDIAYSWRAYDLATAIWGTFGRGGSAELWDALVRGYNTVRSLNEDEGESIKFLIAARHIWWMGLHAATWGQWRRAWLDATFFDRSVELLGHICRDACGLSEV